MIDSYRTASPPEYADEPALIRCPEHGDGPCPCDAAAAREELVGEVVSRLTLVPVDPVVAELAYGQGILPGVEGAAEADYAGARRAPAPQSAAKVSK